MYFFPAGLESTVELNDIVHRIDTHQSQPAGGQPQIRCCCCFWPFYCSRWWWWWRWWCFCCVLSASVFPSFVHSLCASKYNVFVVEVSYSMRLLLPNKSCLYVQPSSLWRHGYLRGRTLLNWRGCCCRYLLFLAWVFKWRDGSRRYQHTVDADHFPLVLTIFPWFLVLLCLEVVAVFLFLCFSSFLSSVYRISCGGARRFSLLLSVFVFPFRFVFFLFVFLCFFCFLFFFSIL